MEDDLYDRLDELEKKEARICLLEVRRKVLERRIGCENLSKCYVDDKHQCYLKSRYGCQDVIQEMSDVDNEILAITSDLITSIDIMDFRKRKYTLTDVERATRDLNGAVIMSNG